MNNKTAKGKIANLSDMPVDALSDYIASTHHSSLKKSLSVLPVYFKTIANVDSKKHAEIKKISALFYQLEELLQQHLNKEENIFFPYIKQLVKILKYNGYEVNSLKELSKNPITKIKTEHKKIELLLEKMRELSKQYTPADDASPSLKLCYAHLFNFEQDIYKHIFLEETLLFPKLIELEKKIVNTSE